METRLTARARAIRTAILALALVGTGACDTAQKPDVAAAPFDGTYRGSSEVTKVISGIGCQADIWEFRVAGNHVKATRVLPALRGFSGSVRMEGEIQPDGTIEMTGSAPFAEIPINVRLTGKFANGSFEGVTRTNLCEYHTTATKTS